MKTLAAGSHVEPQAQRASHSARTRPNVVRLPCGKVGIGGIWVSGEDGDEVALGSSDCHSVTKPFNERLDRRDEVAKNDRAALHQLQIENAQVTFWPDGSLIEVGGIEGWSEFEEAGHEGSKEAISTFSWKSRREMRKLLAKVVRGVRPIFVTLTFPRWREVKPREAKEEMRVWLQRLTRQNPTISAVWKLEPQEDGTPHFHLFFWGVSFFPWQSLAVSWAEQVCGERLPRATLAAMPIVRGQWGADLWRLWVWRRVEAGEMSPEWATMAEAATRVEAIRSRNGVKFYAAKYLSKEIVGQQELWEEPGRFWGVHVRALLPISRSVAKMVTQATAKKFARLFRRSVQSRIKGRKLNHVRSVETESHVQWIRALVWSECGSAPPHDFTKGTLEDSE